MPDEITKVRDILTENLPQPVSTLCYHYTNLREDQYNDQITRLKEIVEAIVKLLSSSIIKIYLSELDSYKDSKDKQKIANKITELIEKEAYGKWFGCLRDITIFYNKKKFNTPPLADRIVNYCHKSIPGGRNSNAFQSVKVLCELFHRPTPGGRPTFLFLFDFLVATRNKSAHGATPLPTDLKKIARCLDAIVACILEYLIFSDSFVLLYVDHVAKDKGKTLYDVISLNSINHKRKTVTQELSATDLCENKEVYIAELNRSSKDNSEVIVRSVSLTPFVIYKTCPSTKTEHVFSFYTLKPSFVEFLCYATGTNVKISEIVQEFNNVLSVLQGDLKAREIFRSLSSGPGKIATVEERKKAEEFAFDALELIKQSSPQLALQKAEESLMLSTHCAKAHFARGLAFCDLGDVDDALESFKKCADLDGRKNAYLLANALTYAALGKIENSLDFFKKIKKNNPTNEIASQILTDPENITKSLFNNAAELSEKLEKIKIIIFQQLDNDNQEIFSWLFRLPPWKQIHKLSKNYSIPPFFSSLAASCILFIVTTVVHYPLLKTYGIASDGAKFLYCRHGIISFICFWGFFNVFAFNALLKKMYHRLGKIVLLPRSAFRQWFMAEMGKRWGCANYSRYGQSIYSTKDLLKDDKSHFLWFVGVMFICFIAQYYNAGDTILCSPYPSGMEKYFSSSGDPGLSTFWNCVQFVTRHALYYTEVYLCVWGPLFIFPFITFFPKILSLPLRYYPGIPASVTLKSISEIFLSFGVFGLIFCALVTAQLFIFNCWYADTSFSQYAVIFYLICIGVIMPLYIIAPQLGIFWTMNRLKTKVLEDVSANIEGLYRDCIVQADSNDFNLLIDRINFLKKLRKICPSFPMTKGQTLLAFLMLFCVLFIIISYLCFSKIIDSPCFIQ